MQGVTKDPNINKGILTMDLIDSLRLLSSRIANTKSLIQTEEATKNAPWRHGSDKFISLYGAYAWHGLAIHQSIVRWSH